MDRFQRTRLLLGDDTMNLLAQSKVAVFGVGGVGSYVVEALGRSGIGNLLLVDKDVVDATNINRQLIALSSTVGQLKVDVAKARLKDINPDIEVEARAVFYLPETKGQVDLSGCDYIVDAIDNVTAKLMLVAEAEALGIPIISSLGTGNKLDNTMFEVTDINKTKMCPLAKVMRKELKKRGIKSLKVVYSREEPVIKRRPPGSIGFVPPVAGLLIAGEVVRDLTGR